MFETTTDRGQVGIGTLIVFIAMVLVAAIAAGVLINTAGFLQAQAEATGEESSSQVSDRVQVSTVTGTAGNGSNNLTEGEIDRIRLTVFRSPGADDIDLTNGIIEVFANGESDTLTHDGAGSFTEGDLVDPSSGTIGSGSFSIVDVQGADDGSLADSSDRAQLVFDLSDISSDAALDTGNTVTVSVTTASGGTAFVEKRAPSTIENDETYRL